MDEPMEDGRTDGRWTNWRMDLIPVYQQVMSCWFMFSKPNASLMFIGPRTTNLNQIWIKI